METRAVEIGISGGFLTLAGGLVVDSLADMMIWLVVVLSIILCDFIAGSCKAVRLRENYSISTAIRRTLGKMVMYLAIIVAGVLINKATNCEYNIDKWAVFFIASIEGLSIVGNVLKFNGYNIDWVKFLKVAGKKKYGIEGEDLEGIITKRKDKEDGED